MKVTLDEAFASFSEHWSPKIAAELNGQQVKLVKFKGEFVWHKHVDEDEMFLVHRGSFVMEFRDHSVELKEGELIVVPRGVEHRPIATNEVEVILFEPATTLNTGNITSDRTVPIPEKLWKCNKHESQ
ncbi:MAG: cupin domain-containing protein [Fimbriimonadaceae bacterium]